MAPSSATKAIGFPKAGPAPEGRAAPASPRAESWTEQWSSFLAFFIYLLVLKTFFLPLFIIPTGSMAPTLYGAHTLNTCPNCATEYPVNWQARPGWPRHIAYHPLVVQCPNCRWQQFHDFGEPAAVKHAGLAPNEVLQRPLRPSTGDRIFVHGWTFEPAFASLGSVGPARWDVVVFKVPTDGKTNYIKRLIGLPGETIELIDGDVFVNDVLEAKTEDAQKALWFAYFDQDHPPREPSPRTGYFPRWAAVAGAAGGWSGLRGRVLAFDGLDRAREEIQFATDPKDDASPGRIEDLYAYNEPRVPIPPFARMPRAVLERPPDRYHPVKDVRLTAELHMSGSAGGYVEMSLRSHGRTFFARFDVSGGVTLEHEAGDGVRQTWGEWRGRAPGRRARVGIAHLDGTVRVLYDGRVVLQSTPTQYSITSEIARRHATTPQSPVVRISAERVRAELRHVRLDRDVYYVSELHSPSGMAFAVQGRPITLGPDSFFVMGDNSPNSLDARYSFAGTPQEAVGPHLRARGDYQLGTVPRDQLIGPAFFVYWPGFLPILERGPAILPDLGRARWIH